MIRKNHSNPLKTTRKLAVVACSAAIVASFQSAPSLAQNRVALEEVIVTATRRDESLQDIAVSVSAIDAELGQATVRRLDDLQTFSPNLYIRRSPGIGSGASITIRGIGTQDVDKTLDPAIGVMMDGVFLGTSSGVLMQNFDVQRIEVLRGPQGTLFGKNTTGGLINIIRGDVTMEWGGDFIVTLDEHGREDVKGVVNVPIVEDKLGIKLFGAQVKSDGYMYNTTLDEDVGGDDVQNYGFAAKWQPTDNFDIKLHYEKTKDESDQGAYVNRNTDNDNTCIFFRQCVYTTADNENENSSETRNFSDNEYDTTILTANYDFGNMVLTYIGATRDMEEQNMQSFDASPAAFLDMNYFNFWDQESHELRLTSNFDGPVNFVAGLYSFEVDYEQYWDVSHLHWTYNQVLFPVYGFYLFPDVVAPTSVKTQGQRQQTDSWAAFFSADWAISDRLTLTVGGRYTDEEKDFSGDNGSIGWNPAAGEARPTGQPTVEYDADWSEFTPSASLRFNMTDNTMLWASYAEGFKSGGFFGRQANFEAIDVSFEPEFLTNMEFGFKSTLLDGAMTLNASYFFSDYDDKQVSVLVARGPADVATVVNNIDSQEINGLEVDLSWQITQNWFVRANYGYLDAEYNEFYGDLNGDGAETENSFMQPRNTPENTFGISTVYTAAIGPGNLQCVLAYRYRDAIQTDLVSQSPTTPPSPTNTGGIGAMGSIYDVSAQLSYMFSDDRYRITVYGKNLTDERELFNQTIGGIATRGYWNDPRTVGVEFAVSF